MSQPVPNQTTIDRRNALASLCAARGYHRADPPLLIAADLVLDLAGEGLGRRLFITSDDDGNELCLRPDFTIPLVLSHLEREDWAKPAAYSYLGPIFRKQRERSNEIIHAGIESLGRTDVLEADADVLALAMEGVKTYAIADMRLRMGDIGLFSALLAALGLSASWRRRLMKDFRRGAGFADDLQRLARPAATGATYSGLLSALEGSDSRAAHALVTDLLSIAGIKAVGGRTIGEIAERFLEQAAMGSEGLSADKITLIEEVLAVEGPLDRVVETLSAISRKAGVEIDVAIARLSRRAELMQERGIDLTQVNFQARFARDFDYYTGLVFDITSGPDQPALVGGGRYDSLTDQMARKLGRAHGLPAVGCAFLVERLEAQGAAS